MNTYFESESVALWFLADVGVKSIAVFVLAGLVVVSLRKASAAIRHLVWLAAIVGVLTLPFVSLIAPEWQVSWLPDMTKAVSDVALVKPLPDSSNRTAVKPRALDVAAGMVNETERGSGSIVPLVPLPLTSDSPMPQGKLGGSPALQDAGATTAVVVESTGDSRMAGATIIATLVQRSGWIWLVGFFVSLLPLLVGLFQLTRITRRARRDNSGEWCNRVDAMRGQLGIERPVACVQSAAMRMPVTWGAIRPVLILPEGADEWSDERKRMVLLHELAHVKRFDWATQMVAHMACAVHWFNPLAWFAARRMRVEREQACDDLVISSGSRPSDYADELLKIATSLQGGSLLNWTAVPMARKSSLEGRLLSILDGRRSRAAVNRLIVIAAFATLAVIVVPIAMLHAGTNEKSAVEEKRTRRNFVRLVTDGSRLMFQGKETSWEKIAADLKNVPDCRFTVLELAIASDEIAYGKVNELKSRGAGLAREHNFEYASFVGVHPLASKGSKAEAWIRSGDEPGGAAKEPVPANPNQRLVLPPAGAATSKAKTPFDDFVAEQLKGDVAENTVQVPILGDVPMIGRLFQSKGKPTDGRDEKVTNPRLSPRQVAGKWMERVFAQDFKGAMQWTTNANGIASLKPLEELWSLKTMHPVRQIGNDQSAMVFTNPYRTRDRQTKMMHFLLTKQNGRWLIAEAFHADAESIKRLSDGFRMHSGVKYDVQPGELIGAWAVKRTGEDDFTLLSKGHLVDDRVARGNADGQWSVQGDVFTWAVNGRKATGRIVLLNDDFFQIEHADGRYSHWHRKKPVSTLAAVDATGSPLTPDKFDPNLPNPSASGLDAFSTPQPASPSVDRASEDRGKALDEKILQLTRTKLARIRKRHQSGLATTLDVIEAEYEVAKAERPNDLLYQAEARQKVLQKRCAVAENMYKVGQMTDTELLDLDLELAKVAREIHRLKATRNMAPKRSDDAHFGGLALHIAECELKLSQNRNVLRRVEKLTGKERWNNLASWEPDSRLAELMKAYQETETARSELSRTHSSKHPKVIQLNDSLARQSKAIDESALALIKRVEIENETIQNHLKELAERGQTGKSNRQVSPLPPRKELAPF